MVLLLPKHVYTMSMWQARFGHICISTMNPIRFNLNDKCNKIYFMLTLIYEQKKKEIRESIALHQNVCSKSLTTKILTFNGRLLGLKVVDLLTHRVKHFYYLWSIYLFSTVCCLMRILVCIVAKINDARGIYRLRDLFEFNILEFK